MKEKDIELEEYCDEMTQFYFECYLKDLETEKRKIESNETNRFIGESDFL